MYLTALSAEGFRNLEPLAITPHRRFNILEGRNGQGKTNLLEAIYLLSVFRSFRDAKNREMVQWGASQAAVRGDVLRRGVSRDVMVTISGKGKVVDLDGKRIGRLPDAHTHLNVVLFGPDDLALTKEGPALRRRFLDRATYAVWPDFVTDLRGYTGALKHRNKLLRLAADGQALDATVLEAFESELVAYGARVVQRRLAFLAGFRPHFQDVFTAITGGELSGDVRYRGFSGPRVARGEASLESLEDAYREALDRTRATDRARGFTSAGPHTHDLSFQLGERSARIYASQGQHRAFVLALKIAELMRITEAIGAEPVFLLDDVSSELDEARNAQLMEYLDHIGGQVFITTTDRRWIKVTSACTVYRVAGGVIDAV